MALEGTATGAEGSGPDPAAPPAGGETAPSGTPTPSPTPAAADAGAGTAEPSVAEFIGQEEFEKVKDDPAALHKALVKAYTQKTQELGAERQIIAAYKRDPEKTLRILADHHKLKFADPTPPTPGEKTVDEINVILEEALGPDLAGKLKPAFEKLAKRVVGSEIEPVRQHMDNQLANAALAETSAVMSKFETKYPDWKKHEPKMLEIARSVQPAPGTEAIAYMETLYKLATFDLSDADRVRTTVDRIKNAASASDKPSGSVPGNKVSPTPKKFKSVDDAVSAAFEAAKRGERWEPRA
jgi:hypothetical protein